VTGLSGLFLLAAALAIGATIGVQYNFLREPPRFSTLVRPALNLAALGVPIYGYTLLVSALDHVRWRPTMVGSVLTLAGFIAWVISVNPVMQEYTWRVYLERISIFKLYKPVDAAAGGESLSFNIGVLAAIGAACIVFAFVAFNRRDLPANG
jgi:ABC-2 type transport system permease protein